MLTFPGPAEQINRVVTGGWPEGPQTKFISAVLHLLLVKVSACGPDLGTTGRGDNRPLPPLLLSQLSLQKEPGWDPDSSIYSRSLSAGQVNKYRELGWTGTKDGK